MTLAGTLTVDGRAAAGEQVVLFAPGRPPLLAFAESSDGGAFALEAPAPLPDGAGLLAKARRDAIGAGWVPLDGAPAAEVALAGPFHPVQLRLSGSEPPPGLTLWLDPESLPGVPAEAMKALYVSGPRVRDAHFVRRPMPANGSLLRVAPGRWRLGVEALYPDRAPGAEPAPDRAAVRATASGAPLPGSWQEGFALEVDGPLEVALELAPV
jgi:hypothetical protein